MSACRASCASRAGQPSVEKKGYSRVASVVDPEVNGYRHGPEKPVVFCTPPYPRVVGQHHLATALPTAHVPVVLDNACTAQRLREQATRWKISRQHGPALSRKEVARAEGVGVFRVLVGYGVVTFAVLQIVEPIMHALHLPGAALTHYGARAGAGIYRGPPGTSGTATIAGRTTVDEALREMVPVAEGPAVTAADPSSQTATEAILLLCYEGGRGASLHRRRTGVGCDHAGGPLEEPRPSLRAPRRRWPRR
jgi:hypothetical protein